MHVHEDPRPLPIVLPEVVRACRGMPGVRAQPGRFSHVVLGRGLRRARVTLHPTTRGTRVVVEGYPLPELGTLVWNVVRGVLR